MLRALGVFVFALIAVASPAIAKEKCTPFEATVFRMADEAMGFRFNRKFREYGWSVAGPTNDWLRRRSALDDDAMMSFRFKYGFSLTEVYQVVDEYRTEGGLDRFFQEMEDEILSSKRCRF